VNIVCLHKIAMRLICIAQQSIALREDCILTGYSNDKRRSC